MKSIVVIVVVVVVVCLFVCSFVRLFPTFFLFSVFVLSSFSFSLLPFL